MFLAVASHTIRLEFGGSNHFNEIYCAWVKVLKKLRYYESETYQHRSFEVTPGYRILSSLGVKDSWSAAA